MITGSILRNILNTYPTGHIYITLQLLILTLKPVLKKMFIISTLCTKLVYSMDTSAVIINSFFVVLFSVNLSVAVNSKSEFRFKHSSNGALCEEDVEFQCPAFLSPFCYREVEFQRNAIMRNLKVHFKHIIAKPQKI